MYACMHVCMYACMHACMYVCMYAYVYVYVYVYVYMYVYVMHMHMYISQNAVECCSSPSPKVMILKGCQLTPCMFQGGPIANYPVSQVTTKLE